MPVLRHRKQQTRPEKCHVGELAKAFAQAQRHRLFRRRRPSSLAGRMLLHFPPHELERRVCVVLGRVTDSRIPFLNELRQSRNRSVNLNVWPSSTEERESECFTLRRTSLVRFLSECRHVPPFGCGKSWQRGKNERRIDQSSTANSQAGEKSYSRSRYRSRAYVRASTL